MLSKRKVMEAVAAWVEQQLRDTGGTRSLYDDAGGDSVYVDATRRSGALLFLDVSWTDATEEVRSEQFCLQVVTKAQHDFVVQPSAEDLAELDSTP